MNIIANTDFEDSYIALRKKENRIYSDDEVFQLPKISQKHPHYKEWLIREESMKRLVTLFEKKNKTLKILEVGCGNGWLSNNLSGIENAEVTGLDINSIELQQAERVFKNNLHLKFVHGKLDSLFHGKFDVVLFAASIQYFRSIEQTVNIALQHLNESGEIHIIDTHFYKKEELTNARTRSADYFAVNGFPAMTDHYFHHCFEELISFNFKVLYKPSFVKRKFFGNNNPFPWICIKRN